WRDRSPNDQRTRCNETSGYCQRYYKGRLYQCGADGDHLYLFSLYWNDEHRNICHVRKRWDRFSANRSSLLRRFRQFLISDYRDFGLLKNRYWLDYCGG